MASTLEENRVQARKFAELEQRLQDSQLTIEQRNTQIHELRRKVVEEETKGGEVKDGKLVNMQ
jgi:hypothetical protein